MRSRTDQEDGQKKTGGTRGPVLSERRGNKGAAPCYPTIALSAIQVGDPAKAVLGRITAWGPAKLSGMARALEPFLFEPEQSGLVARARVLLPPALQYLEHA